MDFLTKMCLVFACFFTVAVHIVCACISPDIGPKVLATVATWGYTIISYRVITLKNKEES